MERMLAVMADDPAAALAGFVGMLCFAACPLFRGRGLLLLAYIGNNIGFALHYALLGHWTAVAMNGLMGVQTAFAIPLERAPQLRWAYYAVIPALALASVLTWQGLPSLLSVTATALSTLARLQTQERGLRLLLLASTPAWALHDVIVGSVPGLAADLVCFATGAIMLVRSPGCLTPPRSA